MTAPVPEPARAGATSRGTTGTPLDAIDRFLLEAVQRDAQPSQAALGNAVGLSAAAVNRRIRRLTDDGYIRRTVAVLDPARLGYPLTVIAQIEAITEEIGPLDDLQTSLISSPHVQQCYYVTGEWDFVCVLLVRDMAEYRNLTRTLFFAHGNVKRFKTLVVMDHPKISLDVPT